MVASRRPGRGVQGAGRRQPQRASRSAPRAERSDPEELCERLAETGASMTRQAVSKHLAILEDANLVATVRRGREKLHYLNPVPIHEIAERWIGKYERHRPGRRAGLNRGPGETKRANR